ncbi:uncharacterized protein EI97DRAFT_437312 [Westerdykella ornata]|uniref:Uncharacterized protein n=1 Tax=Westerdykella ornata TaxID=318751 RepID=A0A6A6J728_WESOR|nr:uncharacterized protein EI97DRAFT_437312 [Westerdykella ornata]KAF2272034.1 hypothetical protein EI97DRAFT_437312 [Westerdykella ornata]
MSPAPLRSLSIETRVCAIDGVLTLGIMFVTLSTLAWRHYQTLSDGHTTTIARIEKRHNERLPIIFTAAFASELHTQDRIRSPGGAAQVMAGWYTVSPSELEYWKDRLNRQWSEKKKKRVEPLPDEPVPISGGEYQATPSPSPEPGRSVASRTVSMECRTAATPSPPPIPPRSLLRGHTYPNSSTIPHSEAAMKLIKTATSQAVAGKPSIPTPLHVNPEKEIPIIKAETDSIKLPNKSWLRDPAMRELVFLLYYVYDGDGDAFFAALGPHIARSLFEKYLFTPPDFEGINSPERQLADMLLAGRYTLLRVCSQRPSEAQMEMIGQCWDWIKTVRRENQRALGDTESVRELRDWNRELKLRCWRANWQKKWNGRLSKAREEERTEGHREERRLTEEGREVRWSDTY